MTRVHRGMKKPDGAPVWLKKLVAEGGSLDAESELSEGECALFEEFVVGRLDLFLGIVGQGDAFDDLPVARSVNLNGKRGDDAFGGAVLPAGGDTDGVEVVALGRGGQVTHGIDDGVGRGSGGGGATGIDDGFTALPDGGNEGVFEPGIIGDDLGRCLVTDLGVVEVGEHAGAVVAPDAKLGDLIDGDAGLLRELGLGAVLIKAGHGEELLVGNVGCALHGDEAVGVAGVADNEDADAGFSVVVDRFALADKDFAVDPEEVGALHALLAGDGSDEECPVDVLEAFAEVGSLNDLGEEGEGTVVELHGDTFEGGHAGLDLHEVEGDRLVGAKHGTGGDAEE